jgi:hypothetical protein
MCSCLGQAAKAYGDLTPSSAQANKDSLKVFTLNRREISQRMPKTTSQRLYLYLRPFLLILGQTFGQDWSTQ